MNNSTIIVMTNATTINESSLILFYIMGSLLLIVPTITCICCSIGLINKYIYDYGEYTENSIDNTNKELKFRGIYESLFGSISSPKLTKIIVVTICSYEPDNSVLDAS